LNNKDEIVWDYNPRDWKKRKGLGEWRRNDPNIVCTYE
jgi:hypothetical protein